MSIPVRSCDAVVIQACMLTFYPEFEADSIVDNEIILCLDCSNSMKVSISLLSLLAEFHRLTSLHYQTCPINSPVPIPGPVCAKCINFRCRGYY